MGLLMGVEPKDFAAPITRPCRASGDDGLVFAGRLFLTYLLSNP